MNRLPDLSAVARLVGDPARLKMLAALLAEGELSAGELAAVAGVSPQTASAHPSKLGRGGLIMHAYGARHQVFRLTGDDVAEAVGALSALATVEPEATLKTNECNAKLCYAHLGGTLGSALLAAGLDQKLLEPGRPVRPFSHPYVSRPFVPPSHPPLSLTTLVYRAGRRVLRDAVHSESCLC